MTSSFENNPFGQSEYYYKLSFLLPASAVGTAEHSFDDIALSVASFETDEENGIWTFDLLFTEPPDEDDIKRRLMIIAMVHDVTLPETTLEKLEQQDWLSQVARSFPPLTIGRFYVYGSHVETSPSAGTIPIQVDAGAAFGSGEHGTTSACLEAMDWLAKQRRFSNILDMGCGSGLLAIAAAKLWKQEVLAVDIDPVAVRVTEENAAINKEQKWVRAAVSDGYKSDLIKRRAPFDLILSNILARPLVEFAPKLANSLAEDGVAVLSGLLIDQEQQVLSAHKMQGLKLQKRFVHEEWCTLVIGRK